MIKLIQSRNAKTKTVSESNAKLMTFFLCFRRQSVANFLPLSQQQTGSNL